MRFGILGRKLGMTQIFTEDGNYVPVTVIEAGPCTVLKVLKEKILLGFGDRKEKNTPKPEMGLYNKLKVKPKAFVREIPFDINEDMSLGQEVTVDVFKEKDFVDVIGISIGKGFQGGVKRWHWAGGPDGHGSMHHRRVGSIGGSSYPSRIWKGQHFAGRMGNERKTVQNLEVVKIYKDKNLLLVKGPIPGADNGYLEIRTAKKKPVLRKEASDKKDTKGQEEKGK